MNFLTTDFAKTNFFTLLTVLDPAQTNVKYDFNIIERVYTKNSLTPTHPPCFKRLTCEAQFAPYDSNANLPHALARHKHSKKRTTKLA